MTAFHHVERVFVWLGGAVFVLSLAVTAWWYGVVLGRPQPSATWHALVYDGLLFSIFALHHSVFARRSAKAAMARLVPDRLLRSVYVWTASVLLGLMCLLWRPIGGELYRVSGWPALFHVLVQLAGLGFIAQSVRAIDALDLAGIRFGHGAADLQVSGPYRIVRHPLYLGWMLVVFGTAAMTTDRLLFAVISTSYLIVAIPWEEQSLVTTFGEAYKRYKRDVPWRLIPYIF